MVTTVTVEPQSKPAAVADEITAMRAAMEQAAFQAAEAKAQLEAQLKGQVERDAEMLQMQQQLAAAQANQPAITETTAVANADADDPPRGNHARDSRSRSAEKRRTKSSPVLHR